MDIKDWSSVVLVLFTVAPAVVFVYGASMFLTGRPPVVGKDTVGGFVVVSAVYAAVAVSLTLFPWPFIDAAQIAASGKSTAFAVLSWSDRLWGVAYVAVVPFLLGGLWGMLRRSNLLFHLLRFLHLAPVHHMPYAWDKMFSEIASGTPLVVSLKGGGTIIGAFGAASAASSDPAFRDLYLERVQVDGGPSDQVRGIWLSPGQILSIETVHRAEEADHA